MAESTITRFVFEKLKEFDTLIEPLEKSRESVEKAFLSKDVKEADKTKETTKALLINFMRIYHNFEKEINKIISEKNGRFDPKNVEDVTIYSLKKTVLPSLQEEINKTIHVIKMANFLGIMCSE